VQESLRQGADLVMFSGDKLFGSLLADLELVKTVQPNFRIVFAK